MVATGRLVAARRATVLRPLTGAPTDSGLFQVIHSVLHVAGLSTQPARAVRKGVRPVLLLSVSSCQPGHSARGTDSRDWAAAAENETPDAGLAPARVKLGLPPYLNMISELPGPGCCPGRLQLAARQRTPAWLWLGSASARLGRRRLGTRHRTLAWLRLGPAWPASLSHNDIRVAWSRMLPKAAAAGSEAVDAGLALAPTWKCGAETRIRGNGD